MELPDQAQDQEGIDPKTAQPEKFEAEYRAALERVVQAKAQHTGVEQLKQARIAQQKEAQIQMDALSGRVDASAKEEVSAASAGIPLCHSCGVLISDELAAFTQFRPEKKLQNLHSRNGQKRLLNSEQSPQR
jgi:hypothetical protein